MAKNAEYKYTKMAQMWDHFDVKRTWKLYPIQYAMLITHIGKFRHFNHNGIVKYWLNFVTKVNVCVDMLAIGSHLSCADLRMPQSYVYCEV